jgi:GMP synthase (glutamine-hydrolysing)
MTHAVKPNVPDSVLVILHQEHSTAGRVGRLLESQGVQLDIRRPACGDALPSSMRDHAGAIVFGGPMSANDEHDYIRREIDWIGVPLKEDKPFLGICLGAQLLARHLGCRVYTHPEGKAEIGYYPVRPTEAGQLLCEVPFPETVYQWHREGFEIPADANLLAEGDTFAAQAFEYGGHAFGLQFHPEVTYAMMCRWTVRAHERMGLPNAQTRDSHLEGWFRYDRAVAGWLDAFLRRWRQGAPKVAVPIRAATASAPGFEPIPA